MKRNVSATCIYTYIFLFLTVSCQQSKYLNLKIKIIPMVLKHIFNVLIKGTRDTKIHKDQALPGTGSYFVPSGPKGRRERGSLEIAVISKFHPEGK